MSGGGDSRALMLACETVIPPDENPRVAFEAYGVRISLGCSENLWRFGVRSLGDDVRTCTLEGLSSIS